MKLTYATNKAIEFACKQFHYAKSVPVNTLGYNVYNNNGEWCGVILFGMGAAKNIGSPYGLLQGQILELVRVALNGKQEQTSQVVSQALKQLHKDCPLCRLVVSYADCDQNHLGTIYQATNWIYVGITATGKGIHFLIKGKKVHSKTARDKTLREYPTSSFENMKKAYNTDDIKDFYSKGKRKYLYPLDKKMRKQIESLRQPYPKDSENWEKIDREKFHEIKSKEQLEMESARSKQAASTEQTSGQPGANPPQG